MNAPANIPTRKREVYRPAVMAILPGCHGEELEHRCSILLMRDNAGSALRWASYEAAEILHAIQRLATEHAFAAMPVERLKHLRYNLNRLVATASNLETFARWENGDARG